MLLFKKKRFLYSSEEPETQDAAQSHKTQQFQQPQQSHEPHSPQNLLVHPSGEALRQGSLLGETGFAYDAEQGIFYSIQAPWQKQYGYCRFYDVASPFMNLIFDSEPIRFIYEGKRWLIEFWKGQYGMTTGCEIGVYTADEDSDVDRDLWEQGSWSERALWRIMRFCGDTLYRAVDPEDQLLISMTLMKDNEVLFSRQDRHWWLTGFVLGEFSEPEELVAQYRITLKTQAMCQVFAEALAQRGYEDFSILADGKTVGVTFDTPHLSQPITRRGFVRKLAQRTNKNNCDVYRSLAQSTEMKEWLEETYASL